MPYDPETDPFEEPADDRASLPPEESAVAGVVPCPDVASYCDNVLGSLARQDQRRWASMYVYGLLHARGRRTIRQAAQLSGDARYEQSLQQVINQSPWLSENVRRSVSERVLADHRPLAWVVKQAAFEKHGHLSAGVARQFVHEMDRLVNCQLAVTVLMVTAAGSVPLTWRLCLPPCWDGDAGRRRTAHIPDHLRHRPPAAEAVAVLDELSTGWGLPVTPVVFDDEFRRDAVGLAEDLDHRELPYVVPIGRNELVVAPGQPAVPDPRCRRRPPPASSVADLVRSQHAGRRQTLPWALPDGRPARSQFLSFPVRTARSRGHSRLRTLVVDWPLGREEPRGHWLTNVRGALPEATELLTNRASGRCCLAEMRSDLGLNDFQGRSYRGWNHHVTLVSAAQAYRLRSVRRNPA
ncbi:MAG: IS701 family transposase [Kineosporiaceae bacterium]